MAPRDTVKKFADAINAHDLDAMISMWAQDAEVHDPRIPEGLKGKEAIKQNLGSWLQAFPDLKFEVVEPVISEGNNVAFQAKLSGTHTGDLVRPEATIPPTNNKIQFNAMGFWRLNSQGLISEERRYYDATGLMGQLVLSQLGFGNCLRKRLRLLPFFRSVDVGGWQPWDENGMWSGWKGKNETSWND